MERISKKYDIGLLDQLLTDRNIKRVIIDSAEVNTNSQRYYLFKKSQTCVTCKCVGTILYLERNKPVKVSDTTRYHANLYAIKNGKEVLMTKDHIYPKSKGGKNVLSNYQVMCVECNRDKGNKIDDNCLVKTKKILLVEPLKDRTKPEVNYKLCQLPENIYDDNTYYSKYVKSHPLLGKRFIRQTGDVKKNEPKNTELYISRVIEVPEYEKIIVFLTDGIKYTKKYIYSGNMNYGSINTEVNRFNNIFKEIKKGSY